MPVPHPLVFTYRLAVARSPKVEPEFFPTLVAIHTAGGLSSGSIPGMAERGFSLGVEAMRNLDPETEGYIVTRIGDYEADDKSDRWDGITPAMVKHGWRILIIWE